MIDQRIESVRRVSWGAVFGFLVAGGLLIAAAVTREVGWALGAAAPLCLAIALGTSRVRPFSARILEGAIEVDEPQTETIAYEDLRTVWAGCLEIDPARRGGRSYPIGVLHTRGVLSIPAHLNVASETLFQFLLKQLPAQGAHEVDPALQGYLRSQEEMFGAEKVWTFRANPLRFTRGRGSTGARVSLAMMGAGLAWLIAVAVRSDLESEPAADWLGAGVIVLLLGLLFSLYFRVGNQRTSVWGIKDWQSSSLVIGPEGLALAQGTLRGRMAWDELQGVDFQARRSFVLANDATSHGLRLRFRGATVSIPDIYDRPLDVIYARILGYWK